MGSLNHYNISHYTRKRKSRSKSRKSLHLSRDRSKSFYLSASPFHTNQGSEGSCTAHAISHLIVRNVFGTLFPLKMTKKDEEMYRAHSCNEYVKTHKLLDILATIDCSVTGYYKILLFLYVYFTVYENFVLKGDTNFFYRIISFVLNFEYMPKIFDQTAHFPLLSQLLKTIKERMVKYKVKYDTVDINSIDQIVIRKIVDGGFYVIMDLIEVNPNKRLKDLTGHAATIIGSTPSHFVIKNSWTNEIDHFSYKNISSPNKLRGDNTKWIIQSFFVVLPIFENMTLYKGDRDNFIIEYKIFEKEMSFYKKWIFDYISKFKTLKPQ